MINTIHHVFGHEDFVAMEGCEVHTCVQPHGHIGRHYVHSVYTHFLCLSVSLSLDEGDDMQEREIYRDKDRRG